MQVEKGVEGEQREVREEDKTFKIKLHLLYVFFIFFFYPETIKGL